MSRGRVAFWLFVLLPVWPLHELSRKPEYAEYQRKTSRLIPLPPGS